MIKPCYVTFICGVLQKWTCYGVSFKSWSNPQQRRSGGPCNILTASLLSHQLYVHIDVFNQKLRLLYPKLTRLLRSLLTFSVSMCTTSFASGFSSHRGGPDGSFKNATMDWKREKKVRVMNQWVWTKATLRSSNNLSQAQNYPVNNRVTGDDLLESHT